MRSLILNKDGVVVSEEGNEKEVSFGIEVSKNLPGGGLGEKIGGVVKDALEKSGIKNCVEKRGSFPFASLGNFYEGIREAVNSGRFPLLFKVVLVLPELSVDAKDPKFGPNRLKALVGTVGTKPIFGPTLSDTINKQTVTNFIKSFKEIVGKTF